ncbi:hypothetical protein ACFOOP_11945 [Marinicaulis aureus]|uniref:Uncharacterized protein n=1 Tax=Hyphococcus aureus TaxID=2666033 RepID=A0ABW1L2W0_9PROT
MFVVTYDNYQDATLGLTKYVILPVLIFGPFVYPSILLMNDGQVAYAGLCALLCLAFFYFAFKAKGFMKVLAIAGVIGCWIGGVLLSEKLKEDFAARDVQAREIIQMAGYQNYGFRKEPEYSPLAELYPQELTAWLDALDIETHFGKRDNMSALNIPVTTEKSEEEYFTVRPKNMVADYRKLAARHGDWVGLHHVCVKTNIRGNKALPRPASCESWDAIRQNYGIDIPQRVATALSANADKSCTDFAICSAAQSHFGLDLPDDGAQLASAR